MDPGPAQQSLQQDVLKLLSVVHQGRPLLLMQLLPKKHVFALHKFNINNQIIKSKFLFLFFIKPEFSLLI